MMREVARLKFPNIEDLLPPLGHLNLAVPPTVTNTEGVLRSVVVEAEGAISIWKNFGTHSKPNMLPLVMYEGSSDPMTDYKTLKGSNGWLTKRRRACIARNEDYLSDVQQNHLYFWESHMFSESSVIPFEEAERLVASAVKFTSLKEISVNVIGKDQSNRFSIGKVALRRVGMFSMLHDCEIMLTHSDYGSNRVDAYAVLHETAHVIDYHRFRSMSHGPTFCAIYSSILESTGLLPNARDLMLDAGLMLA